MWGELRRNTFIRYCLILFSAPPPLSPSPPNSNQSTFLPSLSLSESFSSLCCSLNLPIPMYSSTDIHPRLLACNQFLLSMSRTRLLYAILHIQHNIFFTVQEVFIFHAGYKITWLDWEHTPDVNLFLLDFINFRHSTMYFRTELSFICIFCVFVKDFQSAPPYLSDNFSAAHGDREGKAQKVLST